MCNVYWREQNTTINLCMYFNILMKISLALDSLTTVFHIYTTQHIFEVNTQITKVTKCTGF